MNGATLTELGEKLSKLRKHLQQVVAELNASPENGQGPRKSLSAASLRRGFSKSPPMGGLLYCHECACVGSTDAGGWTLRLCADDELHAFCPDCDYSYFSGKGR